MDITIIIFLLGGLFLGWSLGANDAANVFGTAVGTRMIRFETAAIVCSIFVILGAIISGAGTTETLGKLGAINALPGAFAACIAAGLSVYAMFPERVGGPPLPVAVELGKGAMPTADGAGKLLTEVIVLTNLTDHPIPRFSIEINDQYLLIRDAPLAANERLELPQRVFTDKRSNHRFNPIKYPVEAVTLTGQLPTGARGVTRFLFEDGVIADTH